MPGIFGLVTINPRNNFTKSYAIRSLNAMAHELSQGHDYSVDTFIAERHGLALGRISHSYLKPGEWPYLPDTVTLQSQVFIHGVLFEGGIREYKDFHSDPHLSNETKILKSLKGFFSLVMFSRDRQSIIIAVDRRASEPIFYVEYNGMIIFAPEVKAILAIYEGPLEVNDEAVPMLLACGHLLGDKTLITSIKRLPAGCYLSIQADQFSRNTYWKFRPGSDAKEHTSETLRDELEELLKAAAKRNLGDPEKTAIFLSGGIDSRGILAGAILAAQEKGAKLHTVSWGISNSSPGSDAAIAEKIAKEFQLQHNFIQRQIRGYSYFFEKTNFFIDGLSDIAAFHPYEIKIMEKIRALGFNRVLRGDEAFGWQGNVFTQTEAETEVGLRAFRYLPLYASLLYPHCYRRWCQGSDSAMAELESEVRGMEPNDAKDFLYFTHRLQNYLHTAAYYKQRYLDHRNVLLDDDILEFLARIPAYFRLDKALFRKAVISMFPSLWNIPVAHHSGFENWAKEMATSSPLRTYIQEQLTDTESGIWDYFNRAAVIDFFRSMTNSSQADKGASSFAAMGRKVAKGSLKLLLPKLESKIRARRHQSAILPYQIMLRFVVLKDWHDKFISGRRVVSEFKE